MKLQDCSLRASLSFGLGELEDAIAACEHILRSFPHHLRALGLLGQAYLARGDLARAVRQFETVLELDPQHILARSALAGVWQRQGQLKRAIAELEVALEVSPGNAAVREGYLDLRAQLERVPRDLELSPGAMARVYTKQGHHSQALEALSAALRGATSSPHLLLTKAECLWRSGQREQAGEVCQSLLTLAPGVLKPKVWLAFLELERGNWAKGSALLHEIRSQDPSDSVAGPLARELGLTLPPLAGELEIPDFTLPLPPPVALAIEAGAQDEPHLEPGEDLPLVEEKQWTRQRPGAGSPARDFGAEAIPLILPLSSPRAPEARGDFYLLLSSADRLRQKYGERAFVAIRRKLELLQEVLQDRGYGAELLFLEEPAVQERYGVQAAAEAPPSVKALVDEVGRQCEREGSSLQHVLLIGGDDIIPFFRLANPAEDDDPFVYSDAPYAAGGDHLYALQRSVARIPDDVSTDPSLLLALLDALLTPYATPREGHQPWQGLWPWSRGNGQRRGTTFGYVARVWRPAAEALYQEMGQGGPLYFSPPVTERDFEPPWLQGRRLLLFNLHGAEGSPHWYGQKDASYPADYPLFPIALTPGHLEGVDLGGAVVFTEACYGADIVGRESWTSLALGFLLRGASCVIGSTKIAYGSMEPPLTGADLLVQLFWHHLRRGLPAGQALTQAKREFVAQLHARQGYLDGDDQKTVIGFVFLGDPSVQLVPSHPKRARAVASEAQTLEPCPPLYCKERSRRLVQARPSGELLALAKRALTKAAPETADCQAEVCPRETCSSAGCRWGQGCTSCEEAAAPPSSTYLVTSRKALPTPDGARLPRIARATIDQRGTILKLSLSK